MNAIQRWFFYPLLGKHVEADQITPRPEDVLWCKAKDVQELERVVDEQSERITELRSRLPVGMKHCTIQFIECPEGHGRLTAKNWIDHGCTTCEQRRLATQLADTREALIRARRPMTQRDPMCCNDFPECHHGR